MQLAKYESAEEMVRIGKVIKNDDGKAYWTAGSVRKWYSLTVHCIVLKIKIQKKMGPTISRSFN